MALVTIRRDALVSKNFLFLVAMPGAPSSVLAPSSVALVTRSDALVSNSFLFLVAMPGAPNVAFLLLVAWHLLLEAMHLFLIASCS